MSFATETKNELARIEPEKKVLPAGGNCRFLAGVRQLEIGRRRQV